MRTRGQFVSDLGCKGLLLGGKRVEVDLCGSLALTGHGHATTGNDPELREEHSEFVEPRGALKWNKGDSLW
jgi:Serine dehydratase beta chain